MSVDGTLIALVDDNEDTRTLMRCVLEEFGYDIGEFSAGQEFINDLKRRRPSVALVDLRLPDIDGMRIPSMVQGEYGIQIPMIAVSARVLKGVREQVMLAGFSEFIPKPIDLPALVTIVQKYVLQP
jgi:CheY-like chemotaxis protein